MNRIAILTVIALISSATLFQNCSTPLADDSSNYSSMNGSSDEIQISSYPSNLQLTTGQSTYLTVSAYSMSSLALSYQWYKDSATISGATANSLYIASASSLDQANYYVRVTDGANTVTTPAFYIQVGTGSSISISLGPSAQTVAPGGITRFEIHATESNGKSLTFQWQKNGVAISGQTGSEMYITNTQSSDGGYYAVVISNGSSSVRSNTVLLTVQATSASCSALGGSLYNRRCYVVNRTAASWANAQATCSSSGGNLTVITSSGENYFVYTISQTSVWIGLSDQTSEGSYVWTDGTALSFSAWGSGEPNAQTSDEDCVEMTPYGSWNDNVCSGTRAFVCEF